VEQLGQLVERVISSPDLAYLRGRTKLLVLQGTPFCNIDCDYCYLPGRNIAARMPLATIRTAIQWVFANNLAAEHLSVIWHAGEPLTLPPSWYESAFAEVASAAPRDWPVRHAIQTNGMLIDDNWCALFMRHAMRVGVSLDGPANLHDLHRRTRSGRGSHAAAMRGIAALKRNSVPFHVICVVTRAALDCPEALIDFFAGQGIVDVGFNIEEIEGVNGGSSLAGDDARSRFRAFFERVLDRAAQCGIRIREGRTVLGALLETPDKTWPGNDQNMPFAILTVTHGGDIYTFSPELAGLRHGGLGSMALGNVATHSLANVLQGNVFRTMWSEISEGIDACERACAYFPLCRGGAPSNKLGELGTFAGTETMACRLGNQEIAEAVLHRILNEMKRDQVLSKAS
jgi:uncharacterized protein